MEEVNRIPIRTPSIAYELDTVFRKNPYTFYYIFQEQSVDIHKNSSECKPTRGTVDFIAVNCKTNCLLGVNSLKL